MGRMTLRGTATLIGVAAAFVLGAANAFAAPVISVGISTVGIYDNYNVSSEGTPNPDGTFGFPARRFQSLSTIAARRLGLGRILGNTLNSYLHREKPQNAVFDCDWLSGCFLMVRRQAVDEVGLLDLRFQKYFEDVDFCLRMGRAGWRVMMNGQT